MNMSKNDTIADIITALGSNEEITINGFGKFSVVSRPERQVRNPLTGEQVTAKASKSVKFKASATLKAAV